MSEPIDYEYIIDTLGIHNELKGKQNVVYEIRVVMQGTKRVVTEQHTELLHHETTFFVVHIPTDNLENFIDYNDLTKIQVEEWIKKYTPESVIENCKRNLKESFYPTKKYVKPNF